MADPIAFACPIAASPATPQPSTKVWDGGYLPAAVISAAWKRLKEWAASITARMPATFACEERTSSFCAMVIRGTAVTSTKVTAAAFACSTIFLPSGNKRPTQPTQILPLSLGKSATGGMMVKTMLEPLKTSLRLVMRAPAALKESSVKYDFMPQPASITTLYPSLTMPFTTSGESTQRFSPSSSVMQPNVATAALGLAAPASKG